MANECYGCNSLAEIKNLSLDCDVILVLPGFNVSQKQITAKLKNKKKLEQLIAYELEELLSEDIETLFFAYQAGKDKNSLDVAVINRAWFEQWLEIFKQSAILLTAVVTDSMLLQTMMQDYLLIKKGGYYLLKTSSLSYAIDNENISYFIKQLKDTLPEELFLISDEPQPLTISETFIHLKPVPIQNSLLKYLTEHYELGTGINLLQGIYKPKLKNDWQQIKWVAIGLFGLLFAATAYQAYQHWQLTQQESKLERQRLKVFQDNFPAVKKIVNPLAQMKNELAILKQTQQQQGQFISLLAKVAIALKELIAQEKIQLLGMEFDNNVFHIKIKANSLVLVEEINQNLAQQQLTVEVESSDKAGDQVNASLKVSGSSE